MDSQRTEAQNTDRPAAGHPRLGRFRRARAERAHPEHSTPRRHRHLSAKVRRYLWYTAGAIALYLASLAYAHLDQASHAAVQATNTHPL
ncbi:hypothetical protein [Luteibacter aegosomatissinici]|uniref:hypothetical protein n=1 Tax=Luteibacter aegosomatissinici TaxID=2911539 RepID=UPI001FF850CB|nr:hypothetical protein [Luteibacter aegosomatissinici]UPG95200.1 hypothetical protein L2Y97_03565 [Luteibacter aegosomatissinici]